MSNPVHKTFSWLIAVVTALLPLMASAQPEAPTTKKLAILNSYSESALWSQDAIAVVMDYVSAMDEPIETDVISLNNPLVHDQWDYERMAEGIFQHYQNTKPNYIVMIGAMAFSLRDRIKKAWGDVPFVLVSQNDKYGPQEFYYTYTDTVYPYSRQDMKFIKPLQAQYNFTLVHQPVYYRETVDMMMHMFPEMHKLVFLGDESYYNYDLSSEIKKYVLKNYPKLEYEWLIGNDTNSEVMRAYLESYDYNIGLLLSTWHYETLSVLGYPMVSAGDLRSVMTAVRPIFSLRSSYLNVNAMGGYYPSSAEVRENFTKALTKMFDGENMSKVPFFTVKDSEPVINYPELIKAGLPTGICPSGTRYVNKPPTFWEENRGILIISFITLGILLFLLGFYAWNQRKRASLLFKHQSLMRSMPIGYCEADIKYNELDLIDEIVELHSNAAFKQMEKDYDRSPKDNFRLRNGELEQMAQKCVSENCSVRRTIYFPTCSKYYDIQVAPSADMESEKIRKVNIFTMDVTAKSHAEHELREFANKLNATLAVARIIPWRLDLRTHKLVVETNRVNDDGQAKGVEVDDDGKPIEQIQAMTFLDEEELMERIHPEDRPNLEQMLRDFRRNTISSHRTEFRIISRLFSDEPSLEWVEAHASVNERDENDNPISLIGSMIYITERKRNEEDLIQARAKAQESDRLKSEFLANMSHEIRTPLNAIVGFSNIITHRPDLPIEKRNKYADIIETNNTLLLQLISDVLDLAKVDSNSLDFNYEDIDVNQVMQMAESTVQMRLKPGVALNLIPGAPQCILNLPRERVSQVLLNLLTNACKFTEQGSINFGYQLREKDIYFYVSDTGIGLTAEGISKLFKRFTKLDSFVQGTGLGLAISKHIVEKMGGNIGVESQGPGMGSTFWFTIPYDKDAEKPEDKIIIEEEQKKAPIKRDNITILIAEDNPDNFTFFQTVLEKENYNIIHAWNGQEAVELYDQFQPAVILMDINMPVCDGYEATRIIRGRNPKVPIIAVTALAYTSDQTRIMQSGFNAYVSKPVSPDVLSRELKSQITTKFVLF